MAKMLLSIGILILAICLAGCAVVKFYHFIRRESDAERLNNLNVKIEADDAIHELKAVMIRAKEKAL